MGYFQKAFARALVRFSSAYADIISTVGNLVISNVDFYKGIKIKFLRRDVSRYFWLYFIICLLYTSDAADE